MELEEKIEKLEYMLMDLELKIMSEVNQIWDELEEMKKN